MEISLFNWICEIHTKRRNINSEMISAKEIKVIYEANLLLPDEKKIKFKFSDGWLGKFKRLWKMRITKSHGESGDADVVAVAQKLLNIQNFIENTTEGILLMLMNVGC